VVDVKIPIGFQKMMLRADVINFLRIVKKILNIISEVRYIGGRGRNDLSIFPSKKCLKSSLYDSIRSAKILNSDRTLLLISVTSSSLRLKDSGLICVYLLNKSIVFFIDFTSSFSSSEASPSSYRISSLIPPCIAYFIL